MVRKLRRTFKPYSTSKVDEKFKREVAAIIAEVDRKMAVVNRYIDEGFEEIRRDADESDNALKEQMAIFEKFKNDYNNRVKLSEIPPKPMVRELENVKRLYFSCFGEELKLENQ